jgi:hypothetical protein
MNTQTKAKESSFAPPFTGLTALAALISFGLLPVASLLGTSTLPFQLLTFAHAGAILLAAVFAIRYFVGHAVQAKGSPIWAIGLFILFSVLTLLNAAPPPTEAASLAGPLYTIKHWMLNDSMTAIRWNADSYAPHLPSLAQLGFLPLIGHTTFPIYSLLAIIITSASVSMVTFASTRNSLMALYGFLLVLTMPLFQKLTVDYSLDTVLAMYSALALLYLLRWFRNEQPVRSLVGLGLVCGGAAAAGFRGLGFASIIIAALPFCAFSKKVSTGRFFLALMIVPTLTAAGILPWLLRNFMWTMNPIFPVLSGYIDTSVGGVTYQSIRPYLIHEWMGQLGYSIVDLALIPFSFLIPGPATTVQLGAKLSPILLLGFVALKKFKQGDVIIPVAISVVYTVCALALFPPYVPALTPIVPALCFLTMLGLDQAGIWCKQYYRLLAHIIIGMHAIYALYFGFELVTDVRPFAYMQVKDQNQYLSSHIDEYPLILRLNRILTPYTSGAIDSTAYLVGLTPAFYYYDFDIRSDSTKQPTFLLEQLGAHDTGDELVSAFLHRGIKLLFVRKSALNDAIAELTTPKEKRIWASFSEQHLETIFEDDTFAVWRILRDADEEPIDVEAADQETDIHESTAPDTTEPDDELHAAAEPIADDAQEQ